MAVDWNDSKKHKDFTPEMALELEKSLVKELGIDDSRDGYWGTYLGKGASSLAVMKIANGVHHKFSHHGSVVVKVYDAERANYTRFHGEFFRKLELSKSNYVKSSFASGTIPDCRLKTGKVVGYVVQSFIEAESLEQWDEKALSSENIEELIKNFFCNIVLAIKKENLAFGELSKSNLAVSPDGKNIFLLDTDRLRINFSECCKGKNDKRISDSIMKNHRRFLERLPLIIAHIFNLQFRAEKRPGNPGKITKAVKKCFETSELRELLGPDRAYDEEKLFAQLENFLQDKEIKKLLGK